MGEREKIYVFCYYNTIGQPRSFDMTFLSLRNAPLDLYFLIDFSSSQNLVVSSIQQDLEGIGMIVWLDLCVCA
jgi:hypothetical protein